jgi:hypothetical protein
MRSTRSSFAIHHDRGHRASIAGEHHPNGHIVVSNPNQLMAVNQQQHLHHQALAQRRRSSIHQSVIHAPAPLHQPPVQTSHHHDDSDSPTKEEQQEQHSPQINQDVKVEITEVKP